MLTLDGVVPYLIARGLLDARSIVDEDVRVTNASRRNLNFKVAGDGPARYFVKQGVSDDGVRTVAHEADVYRFFAANFDLASALPLLPSCRGYDDARGALILDLVDGESLVEYHDRLGRFPSAPAQALGDALGTLHRVTGAAARRAARALGRAADYLHPHRPTLDTFVRMTPATIELVQLVQQSGDLCRLLDALREEWHPDAIIHADLRWDNCRVVSPQAGRGIGIVLVDWEMAGVGDSCWDVGAVFGEYLYCWVSSIPFAHGVPAGQTIPLAHHPIERLQPAMRAFWRAYASHRRPDDVWPVRSVRCAGARLVVRAWEDMQTQPQLTPHALYLLQLALNILTRPGEAAGQLLGLPSSAMGAA